MVLRQTGRSRRQRDRGLHGPRRTDSVRARRHATRTQTHAHPHTHTWPARNQPSSACDRTGCARDPIAARMPPSSVRYSVYVYTHTRTHISKIAPARCPLRAHFPQHYSRTCRCPHACLYSVYHAQPMPASRHARRCAAANVGTGEEHRGSAATKGKYTPDSHWKLENGTEEDARGTAGLCRW